jgi:7,8-dihydropterin-6-yl-methyl-4-(beta-D-ribofuranosyl)aminobenzene 5'-phosphate synthase
VVLTVLAEDSPHPEKPELKADHGFAIHADLGSYSILYDFGSRGTMVSNARALGIDLTGVRSAYLSHGHYDHAGDLEEFLSVNTCASVHHGPGAFSPRWSISKGAPREVGVSLEHRDRSIGRMTLLDALTDMKDYVVLPAASGHRSRPAGNAFLLSGPAGERLQDDFTDELTLVLRSRSGLVVITGCSHRGILNIVDQVKAYCPACPVLALIGGFHLRDGEESEDTIRSTGRRLDTDLQDTRVYSGLCTEARAGRILKEIFHQRLEFLHVGMVLEF